MKKWVCINIDNRFQHHKKLEIYKSYFGDPDYSISSIVIWDDTKYIGLFHLGNFIPIEQYRDLAIDKILE